MRDDHTTVQADSEADVDVHAEADTDGPWGSWGQLWQVPTILACLALIGAGIMLSVQDAPDNDFDGALDEVAMLLDDGRLDLARTRLHTGIEPHLELATESQQARFHALVGDWLVAFDQQQSVEAPDVDRRIMEQYGIAQRMGEPMTPSRLERWADAALDLEELETARRRLAELEALSLADDDPSLRERRNRLLRRMVEQTLSRADMPYETLMEVLDDYRSDALLLPVDQLWAASRQAELRIEDARYAEAIDRLLIDSRRIELTENPGPPLHFGGVHTLLGRAYFHKGELAYAQFHLQKAMTLLEPGAATRATAILLLGRLATAEGQFELAVSRLSEVIHDFGGTIAHLPAQWARAELRAVLGDHAGSLEDFRATADALADSSRRRDVTAASVTESLLERSGATLAGGEVEIALAYLEIAEGLWTSDQVPPAVLRRLAGTHRQIADDLLREAGTPAPPEIAFEAHEHFRAAGEQAIRHVRAVVGLPEADDQWAESLFLAADSYDRAGDLDAGLRYFHEYLAGRSETDPRRPEVMRRIGAAEQARTAWGAAAAAYEELIETYPSTLEATGSIVPLSRVYVAMDRQGEAEQLLLSIINGGRGLESSAEEYRHALVALGGLYYETGQYARAIDRLGEAQYRYSGEPDAVEIEFQLADSYRGLARTIAQELRESPVAAPGEATLRERRLASLRQAMTLFGVVKAELAARPADRLDRLQRDMLRYAHLAQADCAFEMGEYEKAIPLYDQAVRRYRDHHASMSAMIQIVNCYAELGDDERARAAHHRALVRLKQLPPSTFDAPDALMDRAAWERWLDNRPLGTEQASVLN